MPFAKRIIEPVKLCRKPVDEEYKFDLDIHSNRALCGALRQLANLARKADDIFEEISLEFVAVACKTERLRSRVHDIGKHVNKLDAKAVKIPVGDLTAFVEERDHFRAEHGFDQGLFTRASRPTTLQDAYENLEPSPIKSIRRCNPIRTDGQRGSRIFSPQMVLKNEKNSEDIEVDVALRKPVIFTPCDKEYKELKEPKISTNRPKSFAVFNELDISTNKDVSLLPTPEEKQREMSRSQPVTLVPIDITGHGFQRQCEHRASIRSSERVYVQEEVKEGRGTKKRSRRRQTISGIPGHIYNEVISGYSTIGSIRTRSASRDRWERPKSIALEEYVPGKDKDKDRGRSPGRRSRSTEKKREKANKSRDESPFSRSCSLRRSFRSLFRGKRSKSSDLWAQGRPESPDPFAVDFGGTLRRARSLPRSLKSTRQSSSNLNRSERSASAEGILECWSEEEERPEPPATTGKPPRPRRLGNFLRIRRSQSQGNSLRASQVLEGRLERPQSLDLSPPQAIPVATPTTPSCPSSGMNILPGQPAWAAFAADVRLRERSGDKTPREDRQSSSGHWSGSSSSARVSLESEYNRMLHSPDKRSQTSLDKDSALSLNIHSSSTSEERYDTTDNNPDNGEETSTVTGDASTMIEDTSTINGDDQSSTNGSVVDVKVNFTKMNTEDWLNSLKREKQRRDFRRKHGLASCSSNESIETRGLTRLALQAHDSVHKPLTSRTAHVYDEESSVYSVDQEGFYTSMHKDSGLKRTHHDILEEECEVPDAAGYPTDSDSTISNNIRAQRPERSKRKSFLSGLPSFRKSGGKSGRKQRKVPPPPPPRGSAQLDKKSNVQFTIQVPQSLPSSPPILPGALPRPNRDKENITPNRSGNTNDSSESDAEAIYSRLKTKTSISSAAFPSMCSVTPVNSDEEDAEMLDFKKSWRPSDSFFNSLKSTKSADYAIKKTSTPLDGVKASGVKSETSSATSSATTPDSVTSVIPMDMSGCSTWPRSPSNRGEKKSSGLQPKVLDFSPTLSMFEPENEDEMMDSPSIIDPRRGLIQGSSISIGQLSDHSSGKVSSSLMSYPASQSSGSIPSSISEENPNVPAKYQHSLTVKPGPKGNRAKPPVPIRGGSLKNPSPNASGHVFASVVVNNNNTKKSPSTTSTLGTFTPANKRFSMATSTVLPKDYHQPEGNMSTWPRKAKSNLASVQPRLSPTGFDSPSGSVHSEPVDARKAAGQLAKVASISGIKQYTGPVPAPAKLIISSPVASKVSFKENPYKRSVCSPVTNEELKAFWNSPNQEGLLETDIDSVMTDKDIAHQQALASTPATQPVSKPLFADLGAMKHSITFPVAEREASSSTGYGKSWYDGVSSYAKDSSPPATSVITTSANYFSMQPRFSFSSMGKEPSPAAELLPYESRRDSIASSTSTDSGGKPKMFASIKKASPASSLASLKMDGNPSSFLIHTDTINEDERKPTFSSFTKPPSQNGSDRESSPAAAGISRSMSLRETSSNNHARPLSVQEVRPVTSMVVHSRPLSLREPSPGPGSNITFNSFKKEGSPATRPSHLPLNKTEPSIKRIKVEDEPVATKPAHKAVPLKVGAPEVSTVTTSSIVSSVDTRVPSTTTSVSSRTPVTSASVAVVAPISSTNVVPSETAKSNETTSTVVLNCKSPAVVTPVGNVTALESKPSPKPMTSTTPVTSTIQSKPTPLRVSYCGSKPNADKSKPSSSPETKKPLMNINFSPSKPKPPPSFILATRRNSPTKAAPTKEVKSTAPPTSEPVVTTFEPVTEKLPDHRGSIQMTMKKEPTPTREMTPTRSSRSSTPRETPPRELPTKEIEQPTLTITGDSHKWNGAISPPVETKTMQPPPLLPPKGEKAAPVVKGKPPLAVVKPQRDSVSPAKSFGHQRKASTGSEIGIPSAPLSVYNGLNKSLCSLNGNISNNLSAMSGSASNLALSMNSLHKSMSSLAKSTDSINSNSSVHAERNRMSRMAFLSHDTSPTKPAVDPFARFKLGKAKTPERTESKTKDSDNNRGSPKSPGRGAVQGRFVSSMINQFHRKTSLDSTASSASNKSSSPPTSPTSSSPSTSPKHEVNGSVSSLEYKDLLKDRRTSLKTVPVS